MWVGVSCVWVGVVCVCVWGGGVGVGVWVNKTLYTELLSCCVIKRNCPVY